MKTQDEIMDFSLEQDNASNTNSGNEVCPNPPPEPLDKLVPLFPLTPESEERFVKGLPQPHMNLLQHGANKIGASVGFPPHEFPNVTLGSDMISSSAHVDLSLTLGRRGTSSNAVNLSTKKRSTDIAFGDVLAGESSNMSEETRLARRLAADSRENPSSQSPSMESE